MAGEVPTARKFTYVGTVGLRICKDQPIMMSFRGAEALSG